MRLRLLLAVLLALACAGPTADLAPDPPPASTEARCVAHGVVEAVCPKCNPALAAVFQSKGDWCTEHGFPESFCPICHPEREGRPSADLSAPTQDGAPAHGTRIRFKTRETARLAGIETAVVRAGSRDETIKVVARVVYDTTRHALVTAPVPGRITSLHVEPGRLVGRGAPLFTLESMELAASRSGLAAARSRVKMADERLLRHTTLLDAGAVSARDLQEAEHELSSARAALSALEALFSHLGSGTGGSYTVGAPFAGEVMAPQASLGMTVGGGQLLVEVVDTSVMWAELSVPEVEIGRVGVGSEVTFALDAFPDRPFSGTVNYLAPEVTVDTRSVVARAVLANPERLLRANSYGQASVVVTHPRPVLVVPSAAVQRVQDVNLVFVQLAEDEFETRRVELRAREGEETRLISGVAAGETVATTGSFLLKTETLRDSIGAGCCDVE